MVPSAFVDGDAIDDVALAKDFEHPEEVLRSDAKHRGTNTNAGIERDDFVVLQFLAEAVDEMDFRAHGPFGAGGRSLDGCDDALGRADLIGGLCDFEAALELVQSGPQCWRVKELMAAVEFIYVTGMTLRESRREESSLQQASTWPMSAMSAMEQPAFRSGKMTV